MKETREGSRSQRATSAVSAAAITKIPRASKNADPPTINAGPPRSAEPIATHAERPSAALARSARSAVRAEWMTRSQAACRIGQRREARVFEDRAGKGDHEGAADDRTHIEGRTPDDLGRLAPKEQANAPQESPREHASRIHTERADAVFRSRFDSRNEEYGMKPTR